MKNPFRKSFYIIAFLLTMFGLGLCTSRLFPQDRWIPEKDTKEKPFCNKEQSWLWDERQKGYWNQAYCHHALLRQKDGYPRLFTVEEITEGVIKKSKF